MEPGIYTIPADHYHTSEGVSKSMLDKLHPTPSHYHGKKKESAEFDIGTGLHALLLEQEDRFWVQPELYESEEGPKKWNNNAKVCRDWNAEHRDKPILTRAEADMVRAMSKSVHTHPFAGPALRGAQVEQSLYARDPGTGLLLRCRMDAIPVEGRINGMNPILDIKTVTSACDRAFNNMMLKCRWHVQGAGYLHIDSLLGLGHDSFLFIAVEKFPPYAVAVYDLSPDDLSQGRREYHRDLNVYKMCTESGVWPGYQINPRMTCLPDYAYDPELSG